MSGHLQGQQVEVLIDGGSTYNFIQEKVAIHLGLPIVASTNFTVMIGNEDHMCCFEVCANASLQLDGHEFLVDLFLLPIRGADLVLGMQWLAILGPILMDYKALTISFDWKGKSLSLQGRQLQRIT
ncbi:hypothetical protein Patl1_07475 [Pistacia atlantica]|uniref:Uncharacterized protein n=1 Tax=Pistacia atlantica TaxID=434234 RepID=A0ACC1AKD3_9ROSI|nr:hypothetical protein Patl1_07475 [Pistacia atlantica]